MSAVMDAPPIPKDLKSLCALVAERDAVPVAELLKGGTDAAVLAKAIAKGLVVIGRRTYTETIEDVRPRKEGGRQVYDENKRMVLDKRIKVNVEDGWSWTNLGPGRKSLKELLAEDAIPDDRVPKLHVKVTTEGYAASV
jgi:hypothetical protein